MQFFKKMELSWLPTQLPAMREEVERNEALWLLNQRRQNGIRVQRHTQSIFLRSAVFDRASGASVDDIHPSAETRLAPRFPKTMETLYRIEKDLCSDLCRVLYARLLPHSVVYRHIDHGEYYKPRDRYHIVIVSVDGSVMRAGDETVTMRVGELWWFDNKAPHDSENPSDEWRVHLIFDLLPRTNYLRHRRFQFDDLAGSLNRPQIGLGGPSA